MRTSSAKAKGRRLQDSVRDKFRKMFEDILENDDITSRQMGGAGTDVVLSPAAKKQIIFDVECKNQEKINIAKSLKQAEDNCSEGRIPALIFTKNRSKVYVAIELDRFLELIYPERYKKIMENSIQQINDNLV